MTRIPKYADEAAFPQPPQFHIPEAMKETVLLPAQWGLTKREYTAIQIFAGMGDISGTGETLAKIAIRRADALFAELAK